MSNKGQIIIAKLRTFSINKGIKFKNWRDEMEQKMNLSIYKFV